MFVIPELKQLEEKREALVARCDRHRLKLQGIYQTWEGLVESVHACKTVADFLNIPQGRSHQTNQANKNCEAMRKGWEALKGLFS